MADELREIPDTGGQYAVTRSGEVWSLTKTGRRLERLTPTGSPPQVHLTTRSGRRWRPTPRELLRRTFPEDFEGTIGDDDLIRYIREQYDYSEAEARAIVRGDA